MTIVFIGYRNGLCVKKKMTGLLAFLSDMCKYMNRKHNLIWNTRMTTTTSFVSIYIYIIHFSFSKWIQITAILKYIDRNSILRYLLWNFREIFLYYNRVSRVCITSPLGMIVKVNLFLLFVRLLCTHWGTRKQFPRKNHCNIRIRIICFEWSCAKCV